MGEYVCNDGWVITIGGNEFREFHTRPTLLTATFVVFERVSLPTGYVTLAGRGASSKPCVDVVNGAEGKVASSATLRRKINTDHFFQIGRDFITDHYGNRYG